jgi:hypothetical protein
LIGDPWVRYLNLNSRATRRSSAQPGYLHFTAESFEFGIAGQRLGISKFSQRRGNSIGRSDSMSGLKFPSNVG